MAGSFGGAMGPDELSGVFPMGKSTWNILKRWQLTPQRSRWSNSGSEVWHSFTKCHGLSILLPIWSNRPMLEAGCGNKLGFFWILLLQECQYVGPTSQKPCSERYSWWPINLRPPSQVPSVSRLGQVQRHMSRPEAINVFPTYSMCSRYLWYISV